MPILYTAALLTALTLSSTAIAETLRIGSIAGEYLSEVQKFKPLTNHLQRELVPHSYKAIEIVIARSMEQMADKLKQGQVDLFIDSPYPSLTVSQQSGSQMTLRRWKKGVEQYSSVIFVRHDSPYQSINDLKKARFAFEEPFSTASYFLGAVALLEHGLTPVPDGEKSKSTNSIHYRFSGDDSTTIAWVLRKRVDAGTISQPKFEELKPTTRQKLRMIYQSPSVPRQIISYRADFPSTQMEEVNRALIMMDQTAEGKTALQQFQQTRKFDRIPASAAETLKQLQEQMERFSTP